MTAAISSPHDEINTVIFLKTLFYDIRWGEWSLLALYISVLSGIAVAFQYTPETPLYSISTIDLLVPFGGYFRSLHFYSSQLFFLFSLTHLVTVFEKTQNYSPTQWIKLTSTLPVTLLILFTGYVLRADSTGTSAGNIAEAILLDIPLIGGMCNDLFFSITDDGMKRVYVNHIIGFGVLWGWLAWNHVKKYTISFSRHILLTTVILLFSIFIAAPFEPEHLGVFHISGPWFFLGLQELLKYFPSFIAGILFPLTLLIALWLLQKKNRYFRHSLVFISCWLFLYTILTCVGLYR